MAAGDYDTRVEVLGSVSIEDDFGQDVSTWQCLGAVWAAVDYGSGAEQRVGVAKEEANIAVTVRVRVSCLTKAITARHRLAFHEHEWDIETVAPGTGNMRGREITFTAKAEI